jgi:hypothetical protein
MRNSRKKQLALATAAAITGGIIAAPASANVSMSVDGLGDAALVQYWTVKDNGAGPWQSMFRIFNTSDRAVAVKVRFRESDESREVLDFIVWLSPYDAWSGWTTVDADGNPATPAVPGIQSRDMSCTTPGPVQGQPTETFGWVNNQVGGVRYAQFKASAIAGAGDSPADRAANDRLKEGHAEFIGVASWPVGTTVYERVLHRKDILGNMVPECTGLDDFAFGASYTNLVNAGYFNGMDDVGNVLAMNAYLMRLSTGQGGGFEPVMLSNFSTGADSAQRMIWEQVTDAQKPDLDSGDLTSYQVDYDPVTGTGTLIADTWNGALPATGDDARSTGTSASGQPPTLGPNNWQIGTVRGGVDAVSAALMRSAVWNEWANRVTPGDAITNITTQWVLTFPTQHYYLDNNAGAMVSPFAWPTLATAPVAPFTRDGNNPFTIQVWNSEEDYNTYTSPIPGNSFGFTGEVNVINFGTASATTPLALAGNNPVFIFDEELPENPKYDPLYDKADTGWAKVPFTGAALYSPLTETGGLQGLDFNYTGLPATGFALTVYQIDGAEGQVSMVYPHKYERFSTPPVTG